MLSSQVHEALEHILGLPSRQFSGGSTSNRILRMPNHRVLDRQSCVQVLEQHILGSELPEGFDGQLAWLINAARPPLNKKRPNKRNRSRSTTDQRR
jgi:hypothetical protein